MALFPCIVFVGTQMYLNEESHGTSLYSPMVPKFARMKSLGLKNVGECTL